MTSKIYQSVPNHFSVRFSRRTINLYRETLRAHIKGVTESVLPTQYKSQLQHLRFMPDCMLYIMYLLYCKFENFYLKNIQATNRRPPKTDLDDFQRAVAKLVCDTLEAWFKPDESQFYASDKTEPTTPSAFKCAPTLSDNIQNRCLDFMCRETSDGTFVWTFLTDPILVSTTPSFEPTTENPRSASKRVENMESYVRKKRFFTEQLTIHAGSKNTYTAVVTIFKLIYTTHNLLRHVNRKALKARQRPRATEEKHTAPSTKKPKV